MRPLSRSVARPLLQSHAGASTAEFAVVFPAFFLLLFAIFEFARAFWAINTLQYAVSQGARYVMTSPSGSSRPTAGNCATWTPATYQTNIATYLQTQLTAWSLSAAAPPSVVATKDCAASPPTVTVTISVSYTFTFWLTELGNLLTGIPITQHAIVTAPLSG
jgi:Flp pilus assembly protein TadG